MEPAGTRYAFSGEAIGLPELAHGQLKASLVMSIGWFCHVTARWDGFPSAEHRFGAMKETEDNLGGDDERDKESKVSNATLELPH